MFTGIVEEVGKVSLAQSGGLVIDASKVLQGMEPGGSIAVNGACLTVTSFGDKSLSVDIMPETLNLTNLGRLGVGDEVNLERALTLEKQMGGHLVQGHIDDTGRVTSVARDGEAVIVRIQAPSQVMLYIVKKGFIAVDGVSLTVVDNDASSFLVSIVGYTREHTTLGSKRVGDLVNLEVDIIAKYVERFSQARTSGITVDFLKEHGFSVA
ncbi:MAG: riboflavin synthase [Dehalococcoidales bacterium]|nr:riboflavin synthase [Dehalococcoidales bacterium]